MESPQSHDHQEPGWLGGVLRFCLERRVVVFVLTLVVIVWGLSVAPFDWQTLDLPRDPVPVDAIPDIGENQQIVFTKWPGRSPQDVEDQISYPLTAALLGVPGVRTIRSSSMFGFSSIYVIFEEEVAFYWSRSRLLEKLASLPSGSLPEGVSPTLGPDATALGQIFWYTLEGRDSQGKPAGGWDLHELRAIQDWQVRYALMSAGGVSEVSSIGGHVREYQIDVDPDALRAFDVTLEQVFQAVRMSNLDVGARTLEINRVEYVVRGIGFIKTLEDLEGTVIKTNEGTPVHLRNVAHVSLGPALRRGVLDKEGTEAVGGVIVARYGENPLTTIQNVKQRIAEIAPGLPRKTLADGTESQVTIVPFYDRTKLIHETLHTLEKALTEEVLITVLVVLIMVMHFGSALIIAGLLPLAVLATFVLMKSTGIDANVVALSGIAIAIGTMVDMGIVITENILRRLRQATDQVDRLESVRSASTEVAGPVLTAVATTIVGFLPVFFMSGAEGKLFKPLAFTKTYALVASLLVALFLIPPLAYSSLRRFDLQPRRWRARLTRGALWLVVALVVVLLARQWAPLGPSRGLVLNTLFVGSVVGVFLLALRLFERSYRRLLGACLRHKVAFLSLPTATIALGVFIWLGLPVLTDHLPTSLRTWGPISRLSHAFPGLGQEFMPPLDEGSYLFMPTTMPHASIGEAHELLRTQDMLLNQIPEVDAAVGKVGRVDSPLDPAPISMVETIVTILPEYLERDDGTQPRFRLDPSETDFFRDADGNPVPAPDGMPYVVPGRFERNEHGQLIEDRRGRPFRQWRPPLEERWNEGRVPWRGIREPDDVWEQISKVTEIPGATRAPRLQPIAARLVMLQSGMRAPMGIKVKGPDLESIERFGLDAEKWIQQVPSVRPETVLADRVVGKPYLEIEIDREAIAQHGIHLARVQNVIELAVGGRSITRTVEGRERYDVRVRYMRELRDSVEALERILVAAPGGAQIPLGQLAQIHFVRGPQMIKSEDTFLVSYVIFDRIADAAEVDVVQDVRSVLEAKIAAGELIVPPGVSYSFAGTYENQVRARKKLVVVLPLALALIFLILYLQFGSVGTTGMVFLGIAVAWAGGFVLIWLYGQTWFLDLPFVGGFLRELFQVHPLHLSVAVWVGFLALFGIATDNGVIIASYLDKVFARNRPETAEQIRAAALEAGILRIRPCLMTTATTLLALLPVLTSTGRGADIMIPMAIPTFGGMAFVVLTTLMVPVLYAARAERRLAATSPEGDHR